MTRKHNIWNDVQALNDERVDWIRYLATIEKSDPDYADIEKIIDQIGKEHRLLFLLATSYTRIICKNGSCCD